MDNKRKTEPSFTIFSIWKSSNEILKGGSSKGVELSQETVKRGFVGYF